MKLQELIKERVYHTDKFTGTDAGHSYLDIYSKLFEPIKDNVKSVLEIGVQSGDCLVLWSKYFKNATIFGVDPDMSNLLPNMIGGRIAIFKNDAYTKEFVDSLSPNSFDVLIDDGSHMLEHMKFAVENYSKLLSDKGILVIEDIASMEYAEILLNSVPEELKKYAKIEDLRHLTNRWDDILLIINKS